MADIFVSYASADRERARQLADALVQRGYSVWWDRTIPPGRVFDEVIQEAIHAARCMIVLWSAEAVRSNWVKTEAAEGVERGILVPALIGDVAPPIEFKRIQSANLTQWAGEANHAEYRNLLESIERLIKQAPQAAGDTPRTLQTHQPVAGGLGTQGKTIKTFASGAAVALAVVGAFWLYGRLANQPAAPLVPDKPVANMPSAKSSAQGEQSAAAPAPGAVTAAPPAPRGRVNLLSADQGGQLIVASNESWKDLIDGQEDTKTLVNGGNFGVYGFRDGRSALLDGFAVLVAEASEHNVKDFELFVGNAAPTGPFESVGRFTTQNIRVMQSPYQEFRFQPVKAKYFKLLPLNSHSDRTWMFVSEIQLFGQLQ